MSKLKNSLLIGGAAALLFTGSAMDNGQAAPKKAVAKKMSGKRPVAKAGVKKPGGAGANMMVLKLDLPDPAFLGTPKAIPPGSTVKRLGPRKPFMVPRGTTNVALGKPVSGSDDKPIIGTLSVITNGDKEAKDGSWVELAPGKQWVQIDLKKAYNLYAIVLWHYHGEARIYRDVAVQIADDPDFITNVRTIYNNDQDNTSGLGLGKDHEFFEHSDGWLINAKGAKARYVRLYSNGNSSDDQNHYTEVEVYGK